MYKFCIVTMVCVHACTVTVVGVQILYCDNGMCICLYCDSGTCTHAFIVIVVSIHVLFCDSGTREGKSEKQW